MGTIISGAEESPRVEEGVLKRYEGDTFDMMRTVKLSQKTAGVVTPYVFGENDKLVFSFFDSKGAKVIDPIEKTGLTGTGSTTVTVQFGKETSGKFKVGTYTYCIKLVNGDRTTTIGALNKAVVERCH